MWPKERRLAYWILTGNESRFRQGIGGCVEVIPGNKNLVSGNLSGMIARMNTPASSEASSDAPRVFPNTRWSVVLAARRQGTPEAGAALEAICKLYWPPLFAYVRRSGYPEADAQDVTQEFFRQLLEKRWLEDVDREKGKLRTFLM